MSRQKLALIGLGRAGTIHFKNIYESKRALLKYAVDISQEKLNEFKILYDDERITFILYDKFEHVLQDSDLNAVLICTPTDTHEELIVQALNSGKHVFCEKPISAEYSGIERCYDLAESLQLTLHCSMNRRYDPSLMDMWRALRNKELGKVHIIKTCARDSPKPSVDYLQISNGIYHDCAVHDIDIMIWMLNQKPTSVYATSFTEDVNISRLNDAETVVVSLTFQDGSLGVIDLSRQSTYGYDQRVEVHGTRGMLQSLNQRPNNYKVSSNFGTLVCPLKYSFNDRYAESYVNSLNDFLDCVRERRASPILKNEILMIAKIADLCEKSQHMHQAVQVTE